MTIRTDIRLWPRITDHLIVATTPVYCIKFLLVQMIIICIVVINKQNFGTNTHKPELYILSFGRFIFSLPFKKKRPNDNKYNSGLCVFVPKFAYSSQQYNETSIIIICNSKNLIQ